MAIRKLTEDEITQRLSRLPGWSRQGKAITRRYTLSSFARALAFVNAVGAAAEDMDHHPDIDIRFNQVTLTLTTHAVDGLTGRDMKFAVSADTAAETLGAS